MLKLPPSWDILSTRGTASQTQPPRTQFVYKPDQLELLLQSNHFCFFPRVPGRNVNACFCKAMFLSCVFSSALIRRLQDSAMAGSALTEGGQLTKEEAVTPSCTASGVPHSSPADLTQVCRWQLPGL